MNEDLINAITVGHVVSVVLKHGYSEIIKYIATGFGVG